jgi:hypothetical protein
MNGIILSGLAENIWIAITLFLFVWIYSWAKGNLGSAKLAILFALIIVFLTFYQYPELVWILVILFLLSTFGKEIFSKLNPFEGDQLK